MTLPMAERVRPWTARALVAATTVAVATVAASPAPAAADLFTAPPIGHVWVINLENETWGNAFNNPTAAPYLGGVLPHLGALIPNYYGVGHNSLDNYIAEISGQAPDSDTQSDCGTYYDVTPGVGPDLNGQVVGQGCVYPAIARTLVDQLDPAHLDATGATWKGYMEDMGKAASTDHGTRCPHPTAPSGATAGDLTSDDYVMKHNPFVYFHSIVDDAPWCQAHVVSLEPLAHDLSAVATTPTYSMIVPSLTNTGHDSQTGQFIDQGDAWLRFYLPMIMASPAYRQDGMILVTFDEAGTVAGVATDTQSAAACCNEQPGPNSPSPGISGQGGGKTGAVVISPFVKPGTLDESGTYNHYSMLRSVEDALRLTAGGSDGLGHLGYAGSSLTYGGPGSFGCDVYTAYQPCLGAGSITGAATPTTTQPTTIPSRPRYSDGSFNWRRPGPQGNDLHSIACASAATCVAVGDAGTLLRTSDGGSTWSLSATHLGENLNGVACPTAMMCIAVGDGGTLFTSTDGGGTWRYQSGAPRVTLSAVACLTATACVAVGDGGAITRTTDGGVTWQGPTSPTTLDLTSVWCGSFGATPAPTCLATGTYDSTSKPPTVLASTDEGATWQALSTMPGPAQRLESLTCPTARYCMAVGDSGTLNITQDGGTSWRTTVPYKTVRFTAVGCTSATACVAVGDATEEPALVSSSTTPGVIIATADGGSTFASKPSKTSHRLRAVSCPVVPRCYAVGDAGAVLSSVDNGASWQSRSVAGEGAVATVGCHQMMQPSCQPQAPGAWRALSCPSAMVCYAAGSNGAVMSSTDGGVTWTEQPSDLLPPSSPVPALWPQSLEGASCATVSTCVAVGTYGTLLRTEDSGKHWSLLCTAMTPAPKSAAHPACPSTMPFATLRAVSCPDMGTCVAVGDSGAVVRTIDAAHTWTVPSSRTLAGLNGVSCATASQCVAVGSGGTVLRSADSGATWMRAASGTRSYLSAVSCVDASCVAVGEAGTILRSDDAGATWTPRPPVGSITLLAVSCASATTCAAAGSDGAVLTTASSGASWTWQGMGTSRALDAVSCTSTTHCVVAGGTGAVLTGVITATPLPAPAVTRAVTPGLPNTGGPGAAAPTLALLAVVLLGGMGRRRSARRRAGQRQTSSAISRS
jgi:photosystem II stability/assembly factor-like uncharacterized protein